MRTRVIGLLAASAAASMVLAACGSSGGGDAGSGDGSSSGAVKGKVGVILPDTQSSARYEQFDKPYLTDAFKKAGVEADIQNAQGDKTKMATIADSMIAAGVSVLIIDNLDSPSGATIQQKAKAQGVKTIDYDRLTLGGSADYYVSFDNTKVGQLQGQGLVDCLGASATAAQVIELNGSPTDNNATLFKQGYDSVLDKKYSAGWKKVGDRSVPEWDNAQGGVIFEQLLTANSGKVDGVLAANDGLANAAITILKKNTLKVPVTGQDATVQGLQNILAGDQCMTVYKSVRDEANAVADLAISLLKGEKGTTNGTTRDGTGNRDVPSQLLTPKTITKSNIQLVIDEGFVSKTDLCTGSYAALCTTAGIK
ncbi:MAG: periplasmic binding protein/LacI transcriptional regulator [Pseudonocardiales bacterium]|nr:periplasmic binding protein/LacI transcriptional regulator [Pseudonocardiales bacterium]